MSDTHTLVTFNVPNHIKTNFDELSKFKRVSKTSILNQLIEWYCRNERKELESDDKLNHLIQDLKLRNRVSKTKVKKVPTINSESKSKTPSDNLDDWDSPIGAIMNNVSNDTDWNDPSGLTGRW